MVCKGIQGMLFHLDFKSGFIYSWEKITTSAAFRTPRRAVECYRYFAIFLALFDHLKGALKLRAGTASL